jgi:hypothetical protein
MAETVFFSGKKKTDSRVIIMKSATLLVGKKPESRKRVKISCAMPLNGGQVKNAPEWLLNAYEFVLKNHEIVTFPDTKFAGMNVELDDDNLFDKPAKVPRSTLNKFAVHEVGDSEDPDVELTFTMYAEFSNALWRHIGQYGGNDHYARFEMAEPEANDNLTLTAESDDDEDEEDGD